MNPHALNLNFPALLMGRLGQFPMMSCTESAAASPKKYDRVWNRSKVEALLNACRQFAESAEKPLADLSEGDIEHISSTLPQSASQCMAKFQEIMHSGSLKPGSWTKEEDEILRSMTLDGKSWSCIGNQINQEIHRGLNVRSGKKCKERWANFLDPNIKRDEWTAQEDLAILQALQEHGKKWTLIRKHLPNRTEISIKNRILSLVNKAKMDVDSLGSSKSVDILILKLKCQIAGMEKQ